nr:uncharacterized protein LOC123769017 isoform X1 [Procambarus clarkii]
MVMAGQWKVGRRGSCTCRPLPPPLTEGAVMATVTSPPSLQQVCEAAAIAWLIQWSGTLGEVAAQAAFLETHVISSPSSDRLNQNLPEQCHKRKENTEKITRSCISETNGRCCSKNSVLKYDTQTTDSNIVEDQVHSLTKVHIQNLGTIVMKFVSSSVPKVTKQCSEKVTKTENLNQVYYPSAIPQKLHNNTLKGNIKHCSTYLKSILPPLLIDQILTSAWRIVSEQMIIRCQEKLVARSNENYIFNYQLANWTRRAPVLLLIAANISNKKFPLNISDIAVENFDYILNFMHKYLPLEQVNKLTLPKMRFNLNAQVKTESFDVFKDILQKTSLVSLTLNSNVCDDKTLSLLSQLPLQELDITSCTAKEEDIIKGLCGLSLCTARDVFKAAACGNFWDNKLCPLRKSLCRLSISLRYIHSLVYHAILFIFPNLQYYNPHINIIQCVHSYARVFQYINNGNSIHNLPTLKLERINMGHATVNEISEMSQVCPAVEKISLIVELNCMETLSALTTCKQLTHIELAYYPPLSSSIPKINGREILPIIMYFKPQIQYLSLTGFNINGKVLHELSQLPVLKSLELHNSWISNPQTCPQKPFPHLENLSLQFLPPKCTMQLLTASSNLVNLSFDHIASDWEGNDLTDIHIKHLVTSGMISSVQSFSASSPFLTLASLKVLSFLPFLKSISHVARWGLTPEELRCLNHSSPPHVQCIP